MKKLNKYIHVVELEHEGTPYYNIVNSSSNQAIGGFAMHPGLQEIVIQTGDKTWWNVDCLRDTLEYIFQLFGQNFKKQTPMKFDRIEKSNRKTAIFKLKSKFFDADEIGESQISWYPAWRQFCLKSSNDLFRMSELILIRDKLKELKEQ